MSTTSIQHRPTPFIAAAAAVAALAAAGFLAVSLSDDSSQPSAPGDRSHVSVQQDAPRTHHAHPTTSGGHVMLGL